MRRVIGMLCETDYSSFGIAIVGGRVVGRLNVYTVDALSSYVIFSFSYGQDWEPRVVSWIINFLCCVVGEVKPLGLNCNLLPGVERVLTSQSGRRAVSLVPLRLIDLNRCLVDVSVRVMGGTDVNSLLNHPQTRMKAFVRDAVLLACPKLLQVTILYIYFVFW